jgi:hypothetical protein
LPIFIDRGAPLRYTQLPSNFADFALSFRSVCSPLRHS